MNQDWKVSCSDDEGYGFIQDPLTGKWEPPIKQMAQLYQQIEAHGLIQLEWQSPGRRLPSDDHAGQQVDQNAMSTSTETAKQSTVTEFDFDEEFADNNPATAKLSRRKNSSESNTLC